MSQAEADSAPRLDVEACVRLLTVFAEELELTATVLDLEDAATLRTLAAQLPELVKDAERLNWLEANGRALMCWNVSDDPAEENWHAPMQPNNGWTVSPPDSEEDEDYAGDTARAAIDWAMKSELRAARSLPTEPTAEDASNG